MIALDDSFGPAASSLSALPLGELGQRSAPPNRTLPVTGSSVEVELLLAGMAVGLGSLMVVLSRSRRRRAPRRATTTA